MNNRIAGQIDKIVQDFRSKGFPCAHRYGGDKSTFGVVKIIESELYDLQIDLGQRQQAANIAGGVGVCLFVKKNAEGFDYRDYFEKQIFGCEGISNEYEIKYGKKRITGVIAKCWLKGVDWRDYDFDVYKDRLRQLFKRFNDALAKLKHG